MAQEGLRPLKFPRNAQPLELSEGRFEDSPPFLVATERCECFAQGELCQRELPARSELCEAGGGAFERRYGRLDISRGCQGSTLEPVCV